MCWIACNLDARDMNYWITLEIWSCKYVLKYKIWESGIKWSRKYEIRGLEIRIINIYQNTILEVWTLKVINA